jgi:chorismate dehydratase
MKSLLIGVTPFVSSKPLIRGLEKGLGEDYKLVYADPSSLADRLRYGELDAALIPSVEFFRGVGSGFVPDLCISSRGPAHSVRFLFRQPMDKIQRVLVDRGSRSSVAMLRLLLDRVYGNNPDFHTFYPNSDEPFRDPEGKLAPASLIVGDRALAIPSDFAGDSIDLGQWWQSVFHLPFVRDLWAIGGGEQGQDQTDRLTHLLQESHQVGMDELHLICEEVAADKCWDEMRVHHFLTSCVHYQLDTEATDGLREFHRLCVENYLAPDRDTVREALAGDDKVLQTHSGS